MSKREHLFKKRQTDQGTLPHRRAETTDSPRSEVPRRMEMTGRSRLPLLLRGVGNTAISQVLDKQSRGQPLDLKTLTAMEQAFGTDFSAVRVHDDPAAQVAADALDARAFTHGGSIYWNADAPSPKSLEGKKLLAHELAHVVQQQQASAVSNQISQPGDGFEQAAEKTAQKALQGGKVESTTSGVPPAVQRQEQRNKASRTEARTVLEAFLRRVLQTQGGRNLRVTSEVRRAVLSLFEGDLLREPQVQLWLQSAGLPGDPAEFAKKVARFLSDGIDPTRLKNLEQVFTRRQPSSRGARVQQLIGRSAPGSPELEAERDLERRAQRASEPPPLGTFEREQPRIPERPLNPPGQATPEERIEQANILQRRILGEDEPTQSGPILVPVLRLRRIVRDLPGAWREPRAPQLAPPEARTFSQVDEAIQQLIASDALVPPEATRRLQKAERNLEFAGPEEEELRRLGRRDAQAEVESFADAREVARALARRLDVAHQQGVTTVDLRLGAVYNRVRNRRTIFSELKRIALIVRNRLPHRAAGVRHVDVYFGDKRVTRIRLDAMSARRPTP